MSQDRKKVPVRLKKKLVAQAGNKCANPGCPTRRIEYHHIKEWAVYLTHDEKQMIAICPTCHDAVHNGELEINDDTIYRWKGIDRKPTNRDQIYVEPGGTPTLLLGRSTYNTGEDVVIFELKANNKLGFRLIDGDFFVVNLVIIDRANKELVRVTDNHIRLNVEEPARYERVPGHIRLSVPATSDYLPDGVLTYLKQAEPSFIQNGRMPLLDLEVVEPSKVRIKGLWIKDEYSYDDGVIIISENRIHLFPPTGAVMILESEVLHPTPIPGTNQAKMPLGNDQIGFGVVSPTDPKAIELCNRASSLKAAGDIEGAAMNYSEALAIEPGLAEAYNHLGEVLAIQGNLDEAVVVLRKYCFYASNKAGAYNNLGNVLAQSGKFDEAIDQFRRSISVDPEYAGSFHNLAQALLSKNEIDEAIENLQRAITLDGNDPWFHNTMGMALATKGRLDEAIHSYEHAIALDPTNGGYYSNLGYVMEHKGDLVGAIQNYRQAITMDPQCSVAHSNLARTTNLMQKQS